MSCGQVSEHQFTDEFSRSKGFSDWDVRCWRDLTRTPCIIITDMPQYFQVRCLLRYSLSVVVVVDCELPHLLIPAQYYYFYSFYYYWFESYYDLSSVQGVFLAVLPPDVSMIPNREPIILDVEALKNPSLATTNISPHNSTLVR